MMSRTVAFADAAITPAVTVNKIVTLPAVSKEPVAKAPPVPYIAAVPIARRKPSIFAVNEIIDPSIL